MHFHWDCETFEVWLLSLEVRGMYWVSLCLFWISWQDVSLDGWGSGSEIPWCLWRTVLGDCQHVGLSRGGIDLALFPGLVISFPFGFCMLLDVHQAVGQAGRLGETQKNTTYRQFLMWNFQRLQTVQVSKLWGLKKWALPRAPRRADQTWPPPRAEWSVLGVDHSLRFFVFFFQSKAGFFMPTFLKKHLILLFFDLCFCKCFIFLKVLNHQLVVGHFGRFHEKQKRYMGSFDAFCFSEHTKVWIGK